jgi:hypothetical protein
MFSTISDDVSIEIRLATKPPQINQKLSMLLTDRRIILLESQRSRLFSGNELGPDWVLKRSLNAEFHQEFRNNPKGFSKAPASAWWVHGYRTWTWVQGVEAIGNKLEFNLAQVQAFAQWGPGRQAPVTSPACHATVSLRDSAEAQMWIHMMQADLGQPFTTDYVASLPSKPMTGAFVAYTYVFWTAVAAVVGLIPAAVLAALGVPLWILVPLWLVGCVATVRFLRAKIREGGTSQVQRE